MSLSDTNRYVRPYGGRDEAFAAAMERAERGAVQQPNPDDYVARTRLGYIRRRNGTVFMPGPAYDRASFDALPLAD